MALLAGLPAAMVSLWLLWAGDYTPKVEWTQRSDCGFLAGIFLCLARQGDPALEDDLESVGGSAGGRFFDPCQRV